MSGAAHPWLHLMCGLPGSGKSTKAQALAQSLDAVIVSADDYFMRGGRYIFDAEQLPLAHADCQAHASAALAAGRAVIVDNTNLRKAHRDQYRTLARQHGAGITIHFSETPWRWDATACHARCTHGVPLAEIEQMLAAFEQEAVEDGFPLDS